jgi:KUP system potassium uptake protein
LIAAVFGPFLAVDLAFLGTTLFKIPNGGWFPLVAAAAGCGIMWTWWRGRRLLYDRIYRDAPPLETLLARLAASTIRTAGTAVFMTADIRSVPPALLHSLKHTGTLHERVVLMTVVTEDVPQVPLAQRVEVNRLGKGFFSVVARYGFMEQPNVPNAIEQCGKQGLALDLMQTSFFLGRETLVPASHSTLPRWQQRLFIAMSANAMSATTFFGIPPGRVVELGTQIEI